MMRHFGFGLAVMICFAVALAVVFSSVAPAQQERNRTLVVDKIVVGDPDKDHVEITAAGIKTKNVRLYASGIQIGQDDHCIKLHSANNYLGLWMEDGKAAAHLWQAKDGAHLGFFKDWRDSNGCEAAIGVGKDGSGALQLIDGKGKMTIIGAGDIVRKP